jgi:hypothetical protein
MIKRINNGAKEAKTEVVAGTVQAINEKGIKVNDRWYNFSRFLQEKPQIEAKDEVEFLASDSGFIVKFLNVSKNKETENQDEAENLLLNALRSAVKISSLIESEVSIKFSTNDIIKLALTLFIQKSSL